MDIFSESRVDPVLGTKLLKILAIDPQELRNNYLFDQFKVVTSYLTNKSDAEVIAMRITNKVSSDEKLRAMWEYCVLRKDYETVIAQLADLAQKDIKGDADLLKEEELSRRAEKLRETLKIYEV